ncbi:MAG: hypothetical protein RMM53_10170, partial [Bacteroidia bacterium]|nr:hypothetical protein [Bacteroidia bacterium]
MAQDNIVVKITVDTSDLDKAKAATAAVASSADDATAAFEVAKIPIMESIHNNASNNCLSDMVAKIPIMESIHNRSSACFFCIHV